MPEKNSRLEEQAEYLKEELGLDENNPTAANIEKDIEKNVIIRVMPKKFKAFGAAKKSKKTIGAVIALVGILLMAAAVYFGYKFIINTDKQASVENIPQNTAPKTEEKENAVSETPVKPVVEEKKETTPTVKEEEKEWVSSATSSPLIGSSTESVATSAEQVKISAGDSDGDGLSNAEEEILGTDPAKIDSDGDTYSDLSELDNSYNPAGAGKITDNIRLRDWRSGSFKYSVLIPASWNIKETGQGESMIFSAPDNSFVQIVSAANPEKRDILSWYNDQAAETPAVAAAVVIKNGWQGIYSSDGNIFYLTDGAYGNIFTVSYVPADENNPAYKNIFRMVVNSFVTGK
jgi:hypothetical protein